MFTLWFSPNHIPIKYRGLIKKRSHLRPNRFHRLSHWLAGVVAHFVGDTNIDLEAKMEPRAKSHLCSAGPHPLPRLLHYPVFLPEPAWEFFPVGNQYDNTLSLKPLSSFGMWRNSIN